MHKTIPPLLSALLCASILVTVVVSRHLKIIHAGIKKKKRTGSLEKICALSPCVSAIQVSRLAGVLVKNGVQKGDLVVIYMPMVPQAMFTMLACARIGAPHSLIFGGFASKELSVRINHAKVRRCSFSPCA